MSARFYQINEIRAVTGAVKKLGGGPSPSGRGRRDSLIEAGAPGEGRAEREPDRAKHQEKSNRILRPSPHPLPEGEGEFSAFQFIHSFWRPWLDSVAASRRNQFRGIYFTCQTQK